MGVLSKKPLFVRLARPTYGRWLLWRHRVRAVGMEQLVAMERPFLVLANHVHTMDPFIISAASSVHIRWVAGAYLFKLFGLRPLLEQWVGAISKIQDKSDMFTIRTIAEALKNGDVVGLFPEGTRTWDGEPVGFDKAIAKMIKIFGVSVVLINLEGFYGARPRWARRRRSGPTLVRVVSTLTAEEIKRLRTDDLYAYLKEHLDYSYRSWQEANGVRFSQKRGAEGLEQILYLCPHCKRASTITTHRRTIACTACSFATHLDEYDRLDQGAAPITDIAAWHRWETEYLGTEAGRATVFPPDEGVLLQRIEAKGLVTLSKRFSLTLQGDGLAITTADGEVLHFAFSSITSMVINAKNTLEITSDGRRYRIRIEKNGAIIKYLEYGRQWAAATTTGGTA
ncbi:MAG: lysophospholipid acyltransferase family protein [Sphaerochaeta sp.]|jgi:1-acyl-sn-glycerol-3-phosphate acyltransferase|nr:1-acyl-sn-glycerol-3-phosphate acyltransferase [Sphaerochaeta sp.]MDX9915505.1 lysophospholipid acyltransferase family protein [Sphaerochaeta sp.]